MIPNAFKTFASRLGAVLLTGLLATLALPAAAKTFFYVPEASGQQGAWYVVLNSGAKARLVGDVGARNGTYTDNGTEVLVTLGSPLSYETLTGPNELDCNGFQYLRRTDIQKVLFRRVDGTSVNRGRSRVVEIGELVDVGGCTPGTKTPFGNLSDEGFPMLHRNPGNRAPMTGVGAGLTIAGFREPPRPDPYANPYASLEADVATFDTDTTVRFGRSGHSVNAVLTPDQWLVLDLAGFQRGYTRFSVNTANGTEVWIEAEFSDGKPQTVTNVLMTQPLPGASFGTRQAASRMWESMVALGTSNPFFFYLYRDNTGDRVQKDLDAGTESRIPITWRFDGADIVSSRTDWSGTLIERRWTPLGRTGRTMSIMEQELRTPSGGGSYFYVVPRVIFYIDRGPAYPPVP